MGLAERRLIAKVDEGLEEEQGKLRSHLGTDIEVSIDKATFPENPAVLEGYSYYKDYGFPMVVRALLRVACDDMGREAVNDKIKKVLILNTGTDENNGGEKSITLEDGLLTVKMGFYSYSDKLWGEDEMVKDIEARL
jgi:hypothetical protein